MDQETVSKILLEISERTARLEAKLDAYNGLNKKMDRLDERLGQLEKAPAGKVTKFTDSIITAIGTIIGGGIVFLIASNIQK